MTSKPARPAHPSRRPAAHLDVRDPLVLDTRELGRRPGSMQPLERTVPAPPHLGVELIGVPPGSDVELDLRLESVMEGVLVSGTATVALAGECGRCLDPVQETLTVDLQELYAYGSSEVADDEAARMDGDLLTLEPLLRDAVVLALPLTPLCRPDCGGLCSGCGERLDDLPADHAHAAVDPRWAALADLTAEPPSADPQEQ